MIFIDRPGNDRSGLGFRSRLHEGPTSCTREIPAFPGRSVVLQCAPGDDRARMLWQQDDELTGRLGDPRQTDAMRRRSSPAPSPRRTTSRCRRSLFATSRTLACDGESFDPAMDDVHMRDLHGEDTIDLPASRSCRTVRGRSRVTVTGRSTAAPLLPGRHRYDPCVFRRQAALPLQRYPAPNRSALFTTTTWYPLREGAVR
jgi:hypothetical protein